MSTHFLRNVADDDHRLSQFLDCISGIELNIHSAIHCYSLTNLLTSQRTATVSPFKSHFILPFILFVIHLSVTGRFANESFR